MNRDPSSSAATRTHLNSHEHGAHASNTNSRRSSATTTVAISEPSSVSCTPEELAARFHIDLHGLFSLRDAAGSIPLALAYLHHLVSGCRGRFEGSSCASVGGGSHGCTCGGLLVPLDPFRSMEELVRTIRAMREQPHANGQTVARQPARSNEVASSTAAEIVPSRDRAAERYGRPLQIPARPAPALHFPRAADAWSFGPQTMDQSAMVPAKQLLHSHSPSAPAPLRTLDFSRADS